MAAGEELACANGVMMKTACQENDAVQENEGRIIQKEAPNRRGAGKRKVGQCGRQIDGENDGKRESDLAERPVKHKRRADDAKGETSVVFGSRIPAKVDHRTDEDRRDNG